MKRRRVTLGCAIAAAALLSSSAHADTPDPAATLSTNPTTHATIVTGPHHLHKVALNLNVTDWWLSDTITDGVAGDVQLVVEAHSVTWANLETATDGAGAKLPVTVLAREPSPLFPKKILERVAITLPRATVDKARREGLTMTVSGTRMVAGATRTIPIMVPAQTFTAFLKSYAVAAQAAPVAPPVPAAALPAAPTPPTPPPPAAPRVPPPPAAPASAPAPIKSAPEIPPAPHAPTVSLPGAATFTPAPAPPSAETNDGAGAGTLVPSLGLEFVATPQGAMVLMTRPGSIAEKKGIEGGDFIESVDGKPIKDLSAEAMAARIGDPGARTFHMIAAGDVRIR